LVFTLKKYSLITIDFSNSKISLLISSKEQGFYAILCQFFKKKIKKNNNEMIDDNSDPKKPQGATLCHYRHVLFPSCTLTATRTSNRPAKKANAYPAPTPCIFNGGLACPSNPPLDFFLSKR